MPGPSPSQAAAFVCTSVVPPAGGPVDDRGAIVTRAGQTGDAGGFGSAGGEEAGIEVVEVVEVVEGVWEGGVIVEH